MQQRLSCFFFTTTLFFLVLTGCELLNDDLFLKSPEVEGVENGATYTQAVTINVVTVNEALTYEATLDGELYLLGTPYDENGLHEFKVTAFAVDGRQSSTTVTFNINIDNSLPQAPTIVGLTEGGIYTSTVNITLETNEEDVSYNATINGISYDLGSVYSTLGSHEFVITATNLSNSLSVTTTMNFTIINSISESYEARQHAVVFDFTGDWCGACPRAAESTGILAHRDHNIYVMAIHKDEILADRSLFDFFTTEFPSTTVSGYPTVMVGHEFVSDQLESLESAVDILENQELVAGITQSCDKIGSNFYVNAKVHFEKETLGEYYLASYLIKKRIDAIGPLLQEDYADFLEQNNEQTFWKKTVVDSSTGETVFEEGVPYYHEHSIVAGPNEGPQGVLLTKQTYTVAETEDISLQINFPTLDAAEDFEVISILWDKQSDGTYQYINAQKSDLVDSIDYNEEQDDTPVVFENDIVESAVRSVLSKPEGDLYQYELDTILSLEINDPLLETLNGIDLLGNLQALKVQLSDERSDESNFSNIDALNGLKKLETLELFPVNISDFSVIETLTNLKFLSILTGSSCDINGISKLINLSEFAFMASDKDIFNLNEIENLTSLSALILSTGKISDVFFVSNLTNLNILNLANNTITNIQPLANISSLDKIHLGNNQISDFSPLDNLMNLTQVIVTGNPYDSDSEAIFEVLLSRGVTVDE